MSLDNDPYSNGRQGMWGSYGWNTVQWWEWSAGQAHRQREMFTAAQTAKRISEEAESARRRRLQAASVPPVITTRVVGNLGRTSQNVSPALSAGRPVPIFQQPLQPERQKEFDLGEFISAQFENGRIALVLFVLILPGLLHQLLDGHAFAKPLLDLLP